MITGRYVRTVPTVCLSVCLSVGGLLNYLILTDLTLDCLYEYSSYVIGYILLLY